MRRLLSQKIVRHQPVHCPVFKFSSFQTDTAFKVPVLKTHRHFSTTPYGALPSLTDVRASPPPPPSLTPKRSLTPQRSPRSPPPPPKRSPYDIMVISLIIGFAGGCAFTLAWYDDELQYATKKRHEADVLERKKIRGNEIVLQQQLEHIASGLKLLRMAHESEYRSVTEEPDNKKVSSPSLSSPLSTINLRHQAYEILQSHRTNNIYDIPHYLCFALAELEYHIATDRTKTKANRDITKAYAMLCDANELIDQAAKDQYPPMSLYQEPQKIRSPRIEWFKSRILIQLAQLDLQNGNLEKAKGFYNQACILAHGHPVLEAQAILHYARFLRHTNDHIGATEARKRAQTLLENPRMPIPSVAYGPLDMCDEKVEWHDDLCVTPATGNELLWWKKKLDGLKREIQEGM